MRDFIYDELTNILNFFAIPYYPISIFLFAYLVYLVSKKKKAKKILLFPSLVMSFFPSVISITYLILESVYVPRGSGSVYVIYYFAVGVLINILSLILLIIYVSSQSTTKQSISS